MELGPFPDGSVWWCLFFFWGGYSVGIVGWFWNGFCFFGRFFKINLWKQIGEILAEIQFGAWKKNDFNSWRMEGWREQLHCYRWYIHEALWFMEGILHVRTFCFTFWRWNFMKFWLNVFIVVMVHIERALVDAGVACTVKDRACPSEDVEHWKTYLF